MHAQPTPIAAMKAVTPTTDGVAAARALIRRHVMPLPIPYGKKKITRHDWELERYTEADLSAFKGKTNIGMRLGHIVGADGTIYTDRFMDVDLDIAEAVLVAPFFLPPTEMIWGRSRNPRSHWGYRMKSLDGARTVQSFDDPTNPKDANGKSDASVCEMRFSGQTIAPGSYNTNDGTPDLVRWDSDGDPAEVDFEDLQAAVNKVFAAALLARHWREGIRHIASLPLAGMLCRGGMPQTEAETFVRAMCTAAHESLEETNNRVKSVTDTYSKAAASQPYTAATRLEEYIDAAVVAKIRHALRLQKSPGLVDGPDGYQLSDLGNGERFVARYEGQALYCDDQKEWYVFDGKVWSIDRTNRVMGMVQQLIDEFRGLVADGFKTNNVNAKAWARHLDRWSNRGGPQATLEWARHPLSVRPEEFDADPWLLNTQSGTVVLDPTTGTHYGRVHMWQDRMTKMWSANYNPDATSGDLDWYRTTFLPENDRWEFLETLMGYSLSGLPKRYNVQFLGPSHSGKSMMLRMLRSHSGGYGSSLKYQALKSDGSGGDKPRSDLVAVRGARILTIPEVGGGALWDTALFKTMLSGGDLYNVRGAYDRRGQSFGFTCTLWTSGNKEYGVESGDDAAYQRVHVIRFDHPMPEAEQDDRAEDRIVDPETTGEAFLAMALRGFTRLYGEQKGRLIPPQSVKDATAASRNALDPWTEVLEALFVFTGDENDGILKSEAYEFARMLRTDKVRFTGRDKAEFESAMERRGAEFIKSKARFHNNYSWKNVRWSVEQSGVTPPDWGPENEEPNR